MLRFELSQSITSQRVGCWRLHCKSKWNTPPKHHQTSNSLVTQAIKNGGQDKVRKLRVTAGSIRNRQIVKPY